MWCTLSMLLILQSWLHYAGGGGLQCGECGRQRQNAQVCAQGKMGQKERTSIRPMGYELYLVCTDFSCLTVTVEQTLQLWSDILWDYFPLVTPSSCFSPSFWCAVIEEANWLMLQDDIQKPGDGFDAVICLGNSFAHLPDFKGPWLQILLSPVNWYTVTLILEGWSSRVFLTVFNLSTLMCQMSHQKLDSIKTISNQVHVVSYYYSIVRHRSPSVKSPL